MTTQETNTVDTSTDGDAVQGFLDLADSDIVDDVMGAFTVRELDVRGKKKGQSGKLACRMSWEDGHTYLEHNFVPVRVGLVVDRVCGAKLLRKLGTSQRKR